jgi:AcrR family transcriptional regulator
MRLKLYHLDGIVALMKQRKPPSQTIDLILTAAERVVLRDSVMRLTLEAVAREANLSKGGVLYHFATKEALIQAMLERLIQYYEQAIAQQQRDDTAPGRWIRAYVRAQITPGLTYPGESDFPKSKAVSAGLLVAAATNPKLLEPLRERFRVWQEAIEGDGIDATRATIIRLAVDGLWLADLLGIWSPSGTLRDQVFRELMQLSRGIDQKASLPMDDRHAPPNR